jgi:alpha/beta superfamily hydrolase
MGESRKLWIPGPAGKLEAILRVAETARAAAVVVHPHPLHGGTMHNSVVFHSDRELHRAGWTTLRFNFRGVDGSEGVHDEGRGEVNDLAAAASWLRGIVPHRPLYLVGFSFGALCAIRLGATDAHVAGVVGIGVATRYYGYEEIARLAKPFAVVQGEKDGLADLETVRGIVERAAGTLHVIPGAGHLFEGKSRDAAAKVVEAAEAMLKAR